MIENKESFLEKLTKHPSLQDNIMSYVFAKNPELPITPKNEFFENVKLYYQKYKNSKPKIEEETSVEKTEIDEWKGKDLRLKTIRLQSIKGYPKSSLPFGIDFGISDNGPKSIVILGGNATGKSSIYDALEYIYCNEIGEANLRSYRESEKNRYKYYLEHNNNGIEEIFCKVETIGKTFNIGEYSNIPKSVRNRINPNTHFISDYDLYENGQLDYQSGADKSFHNKVAESIGLKKILEFNKQLKEFIPYNRRKETTGIKSATKTIDVLTKSIETASISIEEKRNFIKNLQENKPEDSSNQNFDQLLKILNDLNTRNFDFKFNFEKLQEAISNFNRSYKDYSNKNYKISGFNEIEFLEYGLKLLRKSDECPICQNSKSSTDEIISNVNYKIERIQDFKKATQQLNIAFNEVTDLLIQLLNQLTRFKGFLNRELSQIQEKSEFNTLTHLEVSLVEFLDEFLSGDLFVELANFDEFSKDKNEYIFHLLKNYQGTINELSKSYNSLKFLDQRKFEIEKVESMIKANSSRKSRSRLEQIIELEKEVKDLESKITYSNQTIKKESEKRDELIEVRNLFDEIKEATKNYEQVVTHEVNKIVNSSFAPIKATVEQVLEKYFQFDERNIRLKISKEPAEIDEETGQVLSEVITAKIQIGDSENYQSVGKILNTFHYRLFATMVGVAIAIASRKNTQINLPLVLDDIFYASDFENKSAIETFVKALFEIFREFTPSLPLQLILFTHDQMIFESIANVQEDFDKGGQENIEFAKLFPFKEAQEQDGYLNLVYKYPSYFKNQPLMRIIN